MTEPFSENDYLPFIAEAGGSFPQAWVAGECPIVETRGHFPVFSEYEPTPLDISRIEEVFGGSSIHVSKVSDMWRTIICKAKDKKKADT